MPKARVRAAGTRESGPKDVSLRSGILQKIEPTNNEGQSPREWLVGLFQSVRITYNWGAATPGSVSVIYTRGSFSGQEDVVLGNYLIFTLRNGSRRPLYAAINRAGLSAVIARLAQVVQGRQD